jgi:hypothetical protein
MTNDKHFQFVTDTIKLINRAGAETLKIEPLFADLVSGRGLAEEAIRKVRGSAITPEIREADKRRKSAVVGLNDKLRLSTRNFNPDVQKAARNLTTVFNTYKNTRTSVRSTSIARLSQKERTAAIHNFLLELRGRFFEDAKTAQMEEWMDKLEDSNTTVAHLMSDRRDEAVDKRPQVPMKTARKMLDDTFNQIVQKVNSLSVVEGEDAYREFIVAMNKLITTYRNAMARR